MSAAQIEIQLIAALTAAACAIPGTFLVLRRMALISDAISHSVVLGIALGFLLVQSLNSPLLILGAALVGLLTALLVELLYRTGLVRQDAAIGLVFTVLFSVGVILISLYARGVHLDVHAVLLGELAFAPLNRLVVAGREIGPEALYVSATLLAINTVFAALLYKEQRLAAFDPVLATLLGFSPAVIHYGLMGVTALTAVGAFEVVGAVLAVALFIVPAATAYLLADDLAEMLLLSVALGVAAALGGYWLASFLDTSIAGSMATVAGLLFALAWLLAPEQGLLTQRKRRNRQRLALAQRALLVHLLQQEGRTREEAFPEAHLWRELGWDRTFALRILALAEREQLVDRWQGGLRLTDQGRILAREALHGGEEPPRFPKAGGVP